MNPQVLCQYTLSQRSPCVPLVGPSGAKYADRDTILPEVCVCVLVSDVIYVTGASSEPFKPIDNENRLSSNEEDEESIVPKRSESNLNR